jgi:thioesterase domain-containing protein
VTVVLGVSQVELERGYYMVDLAELMKQKRKHDAMRRMEDVQMILATNNRAIEDADSKKYMQTLTRTVGIKQEAKFSREKFEELRAFTNMGG